MAAEVLNGTVKVGEMVAFGVRDGDTAGIRVAEVLSIDSYVAFRWAAGHKRESYTAYALYVKVVKSSGAVAARPFRIEGMSRVVKLG